MGSKGSKGANEFSPSESSSTLSPNSSVSVSLSSLPPPRPPPDNGVWTWRPEN